MQFENLRIKNIDKPIDRAVTITFELPNEWNKAANYQYYPGQYVVLKITIEGKEYRRCYSLNSCPYSDDFLQITVKQVKGGIVSNYINNQLQVGATLALSAPQGNFKVSLNVDDYKTYFLFGAGSGITPLFSILKSVLTTSKNSFVYLFYGNQNQDTILFKQELAVLEQQYAGRFHLVHTLSAPKVWTTWTPWSGKKGRIDAAAVEWFIQENPPIAQQTAYYICGPQQMNTTTKATLMDLGVPQELIHLEQFGAETSETTTTATSTIEAQLSVQLDKKQHQVTIEKGKTVLQALKKASVDVLYSCESGVCGACKARLVEGEVSMTSCMALDDIELKSGYILICQATPKTTRLSLKFEKD